LEAASTLKAPKPFDAAVEVFNTMAPASLQQRQRLPQGEDRAFDVGLAACEIACLAGSHHRRARLRAHNSSSQNRKSCAVGRGKGRRFGNDPSVLTVPSANAAGSGMVDARRGRRGG
jgi:hypothetical protein